MNVSAADKASGRAEKITIKNDKGRLSKEEVERMVAEAEKFRADDEEVAARIKARNDLENYCYQVKNTCSGDEVAGKLSETDKSAVLDAAKETLAWLEDNQQATKEEYEDRLKTVEKVVNPMMTKLYSAAGGGGMPGMASGSSSAQPSGPTVEEVD